MRALSRPTVLNSIRSHHRPHLERFLGQERWSHAVFTDGLPPEDQRNEVYLDHATKPTSGIAGTNDLQGLSYLNLNRPLRKNAISLNLLQQMSSIFEYLTTDSSNTRVLILRSSSKDLPDGLRPSFCSGADLKERQKMKVVEVIAFLDQFRKTLHELENLPFPTIAAIDGPALGGGLELALACDLRVGGPGATRIGLTETRLGIIPGAGGTQRAARLIGPSKTKDLVFGAKTLDAAQAFHLGLLDYATEGDVTACDKATEIGRKILLNGPMAIKAAKLAINKGADLEIERGLDVERQCYNSLIGSYDRIEGLQAFIEKRTPRFLGK